MNVATYQEKEKNEKTGKRKTGKQATDFKEAACCPCAVVRGQHDIKKSLCGGSAWGSWDPREN